MPVQIPLQPRAGDALRPLPKGRLTSSHIARWCAAQENWAKIHFDQAYARDTAKLPGTLINGALKQHLLAQFLCEAFDGRGWVWRVDYQFTGMDLIGHAIEVRGTVSAVHEHADRQFVVVDLSIVNIDLDSVTTTGTGVVVLPKSAQPLHDVVELDLPAALRLSEAVEPVQGAVPANIADALGQELDYVESAYPLDLSRLRLFAEAVMGVRPLHFDPAAAAAGPHGHVVAPPLFPLHGLDFLPGTHPLSATPAASGREGVAELPRDLATRFGIDPAGSLNGGSKIEVHSLLPVGAHLVAGSKLVAVKHRTGRTGGAMLIFETINKFRESSGRPVLTERHASIYRLQDTKD